MMVTYQQEKLSDIEDELRPMLVEHYDEIAMYKDKIALVPDWGRYYTLEDSGILNIATVRDSGILVGYYIIMVVPNIHYSDDLYAVNDIVLIKPEYRNAKVGFGLFSFVEEWMKELGVSVLTMHMKTSQPFDKLCEGMGWDYTERLYTKCIKGD